MASTVYLDLSVSMSGFLGDQSVPMPVTPLQDLLRTGLRESLGRVGVERLTWRGLGREPVDLPPALADYDPRRASSARSLFSQTETNLVAAFSEMGRRNEEIGILITDNAQDLLQPDGQVGLGFDRSAVARAVSDSLARRGFGVWLIGVQNEFRGQYYSVRLSSGPDGPKVNHPIPLSGPQPLYLWVVTRDLESGRSLVGYLVQHVSQTAGGANGQKTAPVRAIELAPGIRPRLSLERPSVAEIDRRRELLEQQSGNGATRRARAGGASGFRERDYLDVREWRTGSNPQQRTCTAAPPSSRVQELLFLLKVGVDPTGGRPAWDTLPPEVWTLRLPKSLPLGAEFREDFELPDQEKSVEYRALWIPARELMRTRPRDRRLDLPIAVFADLGNLPEQHWLRSWSTDDDTTRQGVEGRTLYLNDVVQRILETTVGEARVGACLELWVAEE